MIMSEKSLGPVNDHGHNNGDNSTKLISRAQLQLLHCAKLEALSTTLICEDLLFSSCLLPVLPPLRNCLLREQWKHEPCLQRNESLWCEFLFCTRPVAKLNHSPEYFVFVSAFVWEGSRILQCYASNYIRARFNPSTKYTSLLWPPKKLLSSSVFNNWRVSSTVAAAWTASCIQCGFNGLLPLRV